VAHFARFVRATKAPARDSVLANQPEARHGSEVFDRIGCASCHVRAFTTAPAGTRINGGALLIPAELGDRTFHPFGDFLLHDVGTGDGIVMAMEEHYGHNMYRYSWKGLSPNAFQQTQNKVRTAPLWGLRLRTRLMHDGTTVTIADAIARHGGEAAAEAKQFKKLSEKDRNALLQFLRSL
jgi:CxxC motif-containing protein (DUF1111 family)